MKQLIRLQRLALAAILIGSCLGLTPDAVALAKDYYLYVASESEDEVSLVKFDGKVATVEKRIAVGVWPFEIEGPHGLTISPDGEYWYLAMAHGKPYGHVYKYKTGTDEMVERVELDFFPATMQISVATGFLYVVNFNLHGDHVPSTVSVVDPESMTELERITTGIMPHGSRLSPDGLLHYSVGMMSDELYEIDALSFEVVRRLNLNEGEGHSAHQMTAARSGMEAAMDEMHRMPASKPTWVYPHPSEQKVYVAHNGSNEVAEVDLTKWQVTRRFSTGRGPYNLEISADGKTMVVTYKSEGTTAIWDLKKGKEVAKLANTRKVSHGVVISPDSRYAFVSVEGKGGEPGSLDVFDLKKRKLVAAVDVGKQAGGIAFWRLTE